MVIVYYDGMDVSRQDEGKASAVTSGEDLTSGRVNQKRRTRAAIVDAARELLREGESPSVARAAEAALVSRTTAYRYFPTQESLLLEVAVTADVDEIEALVDAADGRDAGDAVTTVLDTFNRRVLDAEVQYRTATKLYTELVLAGLAQGDASPHVREGRRTRWIRHVLEPLRAEIEATTFDRLVAGLSMVAGTEAMFVLKDVCRLDPDDALAASRWAVDALLDAALSAR